MNPMVAKLSAAAALVAAGTLGAHAQGWRSSYTLHGDAGLIEMPSAYGMGDGVLVGTVSRAGPHLRANLAFQITPRLSGVLRYDIQRDAQGAGTGSETTRAVDLRYRLVNETAILPAIAIGARNLAGDLDEAGEYVVASKSFGDRLQVTAGLGWGRYATRGAFGASVRPNGAQGAAGFSPVFRGQVAPFAGVEYTLADAWRIKAEYSSDAYTREVANGMTAPSSPFNFGVTYSPNARTQFGVYSIGGRDVGITASILVDPNSAYAMRGGDPAPVPVAIPAPDPEAGASWVGGPEFDGQISTALAAAMANEGLRLIGLQTQGGVMRVRYENTRYRAEAQAMGRLARVLTQVAPESVREFRLEPVTNGIPKSQLVVQRSDVVALENELGASDKLFERVRIQDAGGDDGLTTPLQSEPKFTYGLAPYVTFATVGANDRFQYQAGVKASFRYAFSPQLTLSGAVTQRLVGTEKSAGIFNPAPANTPVPVVRRDKGEYMLGKGPQLDHLTLSYRTRLRPDVYARVSAGYLERMYGGVSGQVLWKPADSRLGLGAEVTYAVKRNTTGLGFQNYNAVTGFVSAYYEFDSDFIGQVDVGRYLAGDWGSTVSLAREFPNGWRVRGYMTVTDVKPANFGPASFDKGVEITIPMNWVMGTPTRSSRSMTISSHTADGGQRVDTGEDLYSWIRDSHTKDLADSWGRFWK